MPFYNPYMKTPDWGSGISDFKSKALMVLMALMGGGMLGGSGAGGAGGIEALGSAGAGIGAGGSARANMPNMQPMGIQPTSGPPMTGTQIGQPPGMGQAGVGSLQMDPQMIQMLIQMLMRRQQQPQF